MKDSTVPNVKMIVWKQNLELNMAEVWHASHSQSFTFVRVEGREMLVEESTLDPGDLKFKTFGLPIKYKYSINILY